MKSFKILICCFIPFVVASCSKQLAKAEAPNKVKKVEILKPRLSTFSLPITLDLKILSDTLNKVMSGPLYVDDSYEDNDNDDVKILIEKKGDLILSAQGEHIIYELPLEAAIDARKEVLFVDVNATTTFEMQVKFKTKLDLFEDWSIKTQTEALKYEILGDPKLDFGVFQIPAKKVLELVLDNFLGEAALAIDDEIAKSFDTKSYITEIWKELQEPLLVDEDYGTWLYMQPDNFFYSPIRGNNKSISFTIGVSAYVDAVTGHKPEVTINDTISKLLRVEAPDMDFQISLKTELYYFKMNEMLQRDLKGYIYEYGNKKKIIVREVELYGNGNDLVLRVAFNGSLQGEVYLTGKPKFDTATQELYLDDFKFDIKSEQLMLKAADWLLSGTFKKQMNKYLKFSLKESIDESLIYFQDYLEENQLDEFVEVNCTIKKAEMDKVVLEAFSLSTMIDITGEVEVNYGR